MPVAATVHGSNGSAWGKQKCGSRNSAGLKFCLATAASVAAGAGGGGGTPAAVGGGGTVLLLVVAAPLLVRGGAATGAWYRIGGISGAGASAVAENRGGRAGISSAGGEVLQ